MTWGVTVMQPSPRYAHSVHNYYHFALVLSKGLRSFREFRERHMTLKLLLKRREMAVTPCGTQGAFHVSMCDCKSSFFPL